MMKARFLLLTASVVALGALGAVASLGPLSRAPQTDSAGTAPLVRHQGMAFAQEAVPPGNTPPGAPPGAPPGTPPGTTPPPPADGAAPPPPEMDAPPVQSAAQMTEEEKVALLNQWKEADPREIIRAKYDDLVSRQTNPQNEESEDFIPDTGRVDPLTRVRSEVPDELKPPRAEEGDGNDLESYLDSAAASLMVDAMGYSIQVINMIQIGLQKHVTVDFGPNGGRQTLPEGASFGFQTFVDGRLINVQFTVASASPEEVVINVTANPQGTTINVSKNFNFIPNRPMY